MDHQTTVGAGDSSQYFERLHRAIWELSKRNPQSAGAQSLKDSWQAYVANKRSYLSKVPAYWDGLLNDYWNWYTREYWFPRNPDKPPAPLTPDDVRPPGGYAERKTRDFLRLVAEEGVIKLMPLASQMLMPLLMQPPQQPGGAPGRKPLPFDESEFEDLEEL